MLGLMYVVPFAMIVIGMIVSLYLFFLPVCLLISITGSLRVNDCPLENQIPIFLIVFGSSLVIKNTLSLIQQVKRYRQNNAEEQTKKHPGEGIIDAFILIWFVAGNLITSRHSSSYP